jgi:protein TonB
VAQPTASEIEPAAKPAKPATKHPPDPPAEPKRNLRPGRQHQAALPHGAPDRSVNGIGRGRSDADTNYRGIVAAHLARYKQFPADAKSRGEQGIAAVFFRLDGAGRVNSVSLKRGSGSASLDREVEAMVHRASPFPAPPSRQPVTFTVPVSFKLH